MIPVTDNAMFQVLCVIAACPPAHRPFAPATPRLNLAWKDKKAAEIRHLHLHLFHPLHLHCVNSAQLRRGVAGSTPRELLGQTESCSLWFSRLHHHFHVSNKRNHHFFFFPPFFQIENRQPVWTGIACVDYLTHVHVGYGLPAQKHD